MLKNKIMPVMVVVAMVLGFVTLTAAMVVFTPHDQFAHAYEEKAYHP